jgi:hypothetical protein
MRSRDESFCWTQLVRLVKSVGSGGKRNSRGPRDSHFRWDVTFRNPIVDDSPHRTSPIGRPSPLGARR